MPPVSGIQFVSEESALQNEEISISRRRGKDIRRRLSDNRSVHYNEQKILTPA
jgi:hypothetical protein